MVSVVEEWMDIDAGPIILPRVLFEGWKSKQALALFNSTEQTAAVAQLIIDTCKVRMAEISIEMLLTSHTLNFA